MTAGTRKGKLEGRRVVLTGVSRGVGFEVAKKFLDEGALVLGVARNRAHLAKANTQLKRYGKSYSAVLADIGNPACARRIRDAAAKRWGAVDLLVNNAGVNPGAKTFLDEGDKDLEDTFRVNVMGPYRLTRALLPLLRKGREPRVINVSSGAGSVHSVTTGDGMSSYRLSKFALNGLTSLFATHLKGKVSCVMMDPGWVRTDMGGRQAPDLPTLSAERALEIALLPADVTGKYLVGAKVGGWA